MERAAAKTDCHFRLICFGTYWSLMWTSRSGWSHKYLCWGKTAAANNKVGTRDCRYIATLCHQIAVDEGENGHRDYSADVHCIFAAHGCMEPRSQLRLVRL